MMKLWLIIFDISSQVSNGFAIVSAPNASTAQLTLMTLGNGNLQGYNIVGVLEVGPSHICLVRILTEGITSRGSEGPMGPEGPQGELGALGPTGAPFTYDMFTPQQLEGLRGPQGFLGKLGPLGQQGIPGYTPLKGIDYFDGERGPEGKVGPEGPRGLLGPLGILGIQGPQGELGPVGPQGPKGDTGEFIPGSGLRVNEETGAIEVVTTDSAELDNTLPITSSGVNTIVGNINVLLSII